MSSIPRRNREPDSEMRILVEVVVWEVISGKWGWTQGRGSSHKSVCVCVSMCVCLCLCVCVCVCVETMIVLVWLPPKADRKIRIQVQIVCKAGFYKDQTLISQRHPSALLWVSRTLLSMPPEQESKTLEVATVTSGT